MFKLKPCPFCGNEVYITEEGDRVEIWCDNCEIGMSRSSYNELTEAWNTRITMPDCQSAEWQGDKCLGYGKSEFNDEPCDVCMKCPKQSTYGIE